MDDKAYACGSSDSGEFGNSIDKKRIETLTLISEGLGKVLDVATTHDGTFILTDTGLYSSGKEQTGELSYNEPFKKLTKKIFTKINFIDIGAVDTIIAHNSYAFLYAASKQDPPMNAGVIVGIVIAIIAGLGLLGFGTWYLLTKCKRGPRSRYAGIEEGNKLVFNDDQW